jgi:hypothetical protein
MKRDFLRVARAYRPAKRRKGHRRTPNRCRVLHGQMAKVELEKLSEKPRRSLWRSPTDRREGTISAPSPST